MSVEGRAYQPPTAAPSSQLRGSAAQSDRQFSVHKSRCAYASCRSSDSNPHRRVPTPLLPTLRSCGPVLVPPGRIFGLRFLQTLGGPPATCGVCSGGGEHLDALRDGSAAETNVVSA